MHHHHSCCCDGEPTEPCTRTGCINGFAPAFGQDTEPVLGCTFNSQGIVRTRAQVTATATYSGEYDNRPNPPFVTQPSINQSFMGSGSTPDEPVSQLRCCSASFAREDRFVTGVFIQPDGSTTPDGVVGILFEFAGSVNLETGRITARISATPRTWFLSEPVPTFDFGGKGFQHRVVYTPGDLGLSGDGIFYTDNVQEGNGYSASHAIVPIFRTGLNGRITPIGLTFTTQGSFQAPVVGSGNTTSRASFNGTVEVRLLNMAVFDPNCPSNPEGITDYRIQTLLDQQARGGGCRGCGDGNTF